MTYEDKKLREYKLKQNFETDENKKFTKTISKNIYQNYLWKY